MKRGSKATTWNKRGSGRTMLSHPAALDYPVPVGLAIAAGGSDEDIESAEPSMEAPLLSPERGGLPWG